MKNSGKKHTQIIALGIASRQTRGAEGVFTDDVLKSRIAGGLATE